MTEEEYIKTRLDDQINWYDHKSIYCQQWFKRLSFAQITLAAFIPLLSGYADKLSFANMLIGIFGACIAIITGYLTINKFQENWIEYRTTCETLKHEKFKYITQVAPYDSDNAFNILVQQIESIISKQNTQWSGYIQERKDKSSK